MIFKNGTCVDLKKEFIALHRDEPAATNQRIVMRSSIMGYELGDIQKFAVKNSQEKLDIKIKKALGANAKLGMADLLAQCYMFCLDNGWDFEEIQLLGLEHLKERHVEIKRDGWGEGK